MKSKNAKKGSKNDKVKRNVQTMKTAPRRHSGEEIISEEELDNRIAIDGDIRLYFTMYLKIIIDGHFRHPKKRKLINLAQYIYDQKVLYIHKHGGYKLMELSSIHAELGALRKPVEVEYMIEKNEKRENFSRGEKSYEEKNHRSFPYHSNDYRFSFRSNCNRRRCRHR